MVLKPNAVVDIAKQGPQLQNLTGMWNARVLDGFTPFVVQFKENGLPVNLTDLNAFIEGDIGEGHYDSATDDIVMTGTPKSVRYTDDGSGNTNLGIVVFRLPPQFFIQTGIFKGFIGLQSSTGIRSTSNDVWFKVLGNSYTMGISCKYFISDFQKALDQADGKITQALNDLYNKYNQKAGQAESNLDNVLATIKTIQATQQNLNGRLDGIKDQIDNNDIVRKVDFNQLSNQLTQQVSQMRQSGLEFFNDLADLSNKYPEGANKLCVTLDNSHQYVYDYAANKWNDAGTFNFGTLDPKLLQGFYAKNPDNLIINSDFNTMDLWTAGRNKSTPNCYIESSENKDGSNALVINGYVKDGTSNQSWIRSHEILVNGHKYLSVSAELDIEGINTAVGDTAGMDITWYDKDNNQSWSHFNLQPNNDSKFHKVVWTPIKIPNDVVKFQLGFNLYGNGQVKVRKPQLNYGLKTLPYSSIDLENYLKGLNEALLSPITDWFHDSWGDQELSKCSRENGYYNDELTTTLEASDASDGQFNWLQSPYIKVAPGSLLNASILIKGKWDDRAYFEVDQYIKPLDNRDQSQDILFDFTKTSKFMLQSFNSIKLNETTNYIQLRLTIRGKGTISFSQPKLNFDFSNFQSQNTYVQRKSRELLYNNSIVNWHLYTAGKQAVVKNDWDVLYNKQPTIQIKADIRKVDGINSWNSFYSSKIKVNPNSHLKLKLPVLANYTLNSDNEIYVEINEYTNQNADKDNNKSIQRSIKSTKDLTEQVFDDINLKNDTNYITLGVTIRNVGTVNFGEPSLKVTQDITKINPATIINRPKEFGITDKNTLIGNTNDLDDNTWTVGNPSEMIPVNSKVISAKALVSATYSNSAIVELKIQQFSDITASYDASKNIDFSLNRSKYLKYQNFNNIQLRDDTKYIKVLIATRGKAQFEIGTISFFNSDRVSLDDSQTSKLPELDILSNQAITDKWESAPFIYIDGNRTLEGYLQFAMQGDSSRNYPKKNLKLKFFQDENCKQELKWKPKSDWQANHKFNIKANWIDATQSRNLVNAKLFAKATANTPIADSSIAEKIGKSQNLTQMEGFPIELYFDGMYYGLMTFNTKKDDKPFGLDADNAGNEAITNSNAAQPLFYDANKTIDGQVFATEIHDSANEVLKSNLKKLITFINTSSDDEFKKNISNYIDINSVINCYLFGNLSRMEDSAGKSVVLLTWNNGENWYQTFYDLDSTWGLWWDGSKINNNEKDWSLNSDNPGNHITGINYNKLYERLYNLFKPEIKAQYEKLRTTVWRNDQITSEFKKFINSIPKEAYERDQEKWPNIPSINITNYCQLQQSIITRSNTMDNFIKKLD